MSRRTLSSTKYFSNELNFSYMIPSGTKILIFSFIILYNSALSKAYLVSNIRFYGMVAISTSEVILSIAKRPKIIKMYKIT